MVNDDYGHSAGYVNIEGWQAASQRPFCKEMVCIEIAFIYKAVYGFDEGLIIQSTLRERKGIIREERPI